MRSPCLRARAENGVKVGRLTPFVVAGLTATRTLDPPQKKGRSAQRSGPKSIGDNANQFG